MRHPLLRILVALLVGAWAPLCCCRASSMVESACSTLTIVADAGACGEGCCGGDSELELETTPVAVPSDANCPSCPSCRGPMGDGGLLSHAQAHVHIDLALLGVAEYRVAPVWELGHNEPIERAAWTAAPPFIRANRAALRWHCALIV